MMEINSIWRLIRITGVIIIGHSVLSLRTSQAFPRGSIHLSCFQAGNKLQKHLHNTRYPRQRFRHNVISSDEREFPKATFAKLDDVEKKNENVPTTKRKRTNPIQWIACASTKEVNRAIEVFVKKDDIVAELGSQLRDSSSLICQQIGPDGRAILVDIERKFPKKKKGMSVQEEEKRTSAMRKEGGEIGFYEDRAIFSEVKSFDLVWKVLFFQDWKKQIESRKDEEENKDSHGALPIASFNVLVVDIGAIAGNDLGLTCISLVKEFLALNKELGGTNENPCRTVIIKSGTVHNISTRLIHIQRLFAGAISLNDKFFSHKTSIIGTVGVDEYRRAIPYAVKQNDVILEIGCHFGTTTSILHDAISADNHEEDVSIESQGGCLGVDIGTHIIKNAKKRYPHVQFAVSDGWKVADLLRLKDIHLPHTSSRSGFDVVFLDVGGLSGSEGLLEAIQLITVIENSLEPRCIVIKSLCIRRLASSLVSFSSIWKGKKTKDDSMYITQLASH